MTVVEAKTLGLASVKRGIVTDWVGRLCMFCPLKKLDHAATFEDLINACCCKGKWKMARIVPLQSR